MTGGTVVVLGACGRNVGAGMSGGELYVLGDMRLNGELVVAAPLTAAEAVELRALVERHLRFTDSKLAAGHAVPLGQSREGLSPHRPARRGRRSRRRSGRDGRGLIPRPSPTV